MVAKWVGWDKVGEEGRVGYGSKWVGMELGG